MTDCEERAKAEADVLKRHLKGLYKKGNVWFGYVESAKAFESLLHDLNVINIAYRTERLTVKPTGCPVTVCRQFDIIVDEGIPFTVLRNARRNCQCCHLRDVKNLESSQARGACELAPPPSKRCTAEKKNTCPAVMRIKQVEMYPAYKVNCWKFSTGRQLEIISRRLMASLKRALEEDSEGLLRQQRFYVSMSDVNSHCTHDTPPCGNPSAHVEPEVNNSHTADCGNPRGHVEPEVPKCYRSQRRRPKGYVEALAGKKIVVDLVRRGMTSVKEVESYVKIYIQDYSMDNKDATDTSANYITSKELQNRVSQALRECRFNYTGQDEVAKYVEELREKTPTLNCFFRACELKRQGNNQPVQDQTEHTLESLAQECQETLLFCIQTDFMKELLLKYSSDVLSLVATYKTTECALPLFFIMMKTSYCDAAVGAFVVQFETAKCIGEALSVWRAWNPDVNPRFWILDCNEAENAAISNAFPCGRTIFPDYQRSQAWQDWLSRKENGVADVFHVKDLLDRIAGSQNEEEFKWAISRLDRSYYYLQNEKLRRYITHWLSIREKWVKMYRDLPVDSYGGEELRLYLTKNCGQISLLELVRTLAEKCFTEMKAQYCWASTISIG